MTCKECPIARGFLPKEAWKTMAFKKPNYAGCVKMVKKNLCPIMQAREMQDHCRKIIGQAASDTAKFARLPVPYFRIVLISRAAQEADREQELRSKVKRPDVGMSPIAELFGGI